MNYEIIEDYISQYKERFPEINQMEIYKWKAVKHFQQHWDIEADDFAEMLTSSLSKTGNLLASGNYLPREMIQTFALIDAEFVRGLFKMLFDESLSLEYRYKTFRQESKLFAEKHLDPEKNNHYQDARARTVYLCLKYPEDHFLYKYGMFNDFSKLIDYRFKPKRGEFLNVVHFDRLCRDVRELLIKDDELLRMHNNRLDDDCYQDPTQHILAQDFIYACARHLQPVEIKDKELHAIIEEFSLEQYKLRESGVKLSGSLIDHEKINRANTALGRAGEDFIMDLEADRLRDLGIKNIAKELKHKSVEEGDGLGYDIRSLDELKKEIFIEVKATSGSFNTPFYISRNELYCSQKHPEKYRLYRLYDFDAKAKKGKVKVYKGDLSDICVQPVNYQIALTEKK
jgi:hypothetical protein